MLFNKFVAFCKDGHRVAEAMTVVGEASEKTSTVSIHVVWLVSARPWLVTVQVTEIGPPETAELGAAALEATRSEATLLMVIGTIEALASVSPGPSNTVLARSATRIRK